ncbi:MAG: DUF4272 domain-containing protein [Rhizobacter sp.]
MAMLLAASGPAQSAPSLNDRKEKIRSMEKSVDAEALQRKERSESVLRAEGVPINKFLPVIETEKNARRRSSEEIAYRALALLAVSFKGEGLEQRIVDKIIADYGLARHLTPRETAFIRNKAPSQHERTQFVWRYEAAWVMLWALGYVDKLEKPTGICDVPRAVKFMRERSTKQFLADAKLRSLTELLDQNDRIYRYHWAVVDARVNGEKTPAALDSGVTMERHYALNWLIGYMRQEWDDITTDT